MEFFGALTESRRSLGLDVLRNKYFHLLIGKIENLLDKN